MAYPRRSILQLVTIAAVLPGLSALATTRPYPSREVRLIVGFPRDGPLDIAARVLAPWLANHFAQAFTVENLVGSSGNLATAMVVQARPDGHTLLLCGPVNTINTTLYAGQLSFDFSRDIAPVAGFAQVPLVLEVHPSLSARSVPELIAYAKSNPGKVKIAYAGTGTPQHVAIELFKMMSGVDVAPVPYPGSAAALADLLSGQAQVMFDPLPSSIAHIRAGRLVPLAVTSVEQSAALPDVPVMSGFLPGYEVGSWFGIGAPRGTAESIGTILNTAVNTALADPDLAVKLANLGAVPMPGSQHKFSNFIEDETRKYRRVIRAAKIKLD